MRITILGFSCSGKTTFATQLGLVLQQPVYHLDRYYWKSPWIINTDFDVLSLSTKENWIMDGTYSNYHLTERLDRSNYIFYLDCGLVIRLWRMIFRHIAYTLFPKGKNPISQKISFGFLLTTINKVYTLQPAILQMLKQDYSNNFLYAKGMRKIKILLERLVDEDISELFKPHST